MNRATPITSALKRKYSPFKKEESETQKEAKQLLTDETGKNVFVSTKTSTPGTESFKTKSIEQAKGGEQATDQNAYLQGLYKRFGDDVTTQELIDKKYISSSAAADYDAISGGSNKGVKTITPGDEEESKVKLKTGVTADTKRSFQSREDLRGGTQAASKSKRAGVSEARAQQKLAKMGYDSENPLKPGDKGYVKQQRLLGKIGKQKARQRQADAEVENFARMSEEGKTGAKANTFYKTQRDTEQGELTREEQEKLKLNSPAEMRFSPAKFKAHSVKAPLKKLTDLSRTNGSPAKYGNKKSPYKMKGYGNKTY